MLQWVIPDDECKGRRCVTTKLWLFCFRLECAYLNSLRAFLHNSYTFLTILLCIPLHSYVSKLMSSCISVTSDLSWSSFSIAAGWIDQIDIPFNSPLHCLTSPGGFSNIESFPAKIKCTHVTWFHHRMISITFSLFLWQIYICESIMLRACETKQNNVSARAWRLAHVVTCMR